MRILLISLGLVVLISLSAVVGVYVYLNSPQFNERLRLFVVQKAGEFTGTQVSLGRFHWSVKTQRLVLEDLNFRGTEAESDPPLGHIDSISAGIKLRSLLQRRIDLFDLQIVGPELRLRVDPDGRTNLPGPLPQVDPLAESRLTVSIDSLKVVNGKAFINDRQTKIDFDVKDLSSDLLYRADTQTLSADVSYTGSLQNPGSFSIPYSLSSEFDYIRGTIIAKEAELTSGKSSAKLQGRIDKVFTPGIVAKLAYTGRLESTFLKQFLPQESFAGTATAKGMLEYSSERFSTSGDLASERIELAGWTAEKVRGVYAYRYPDKQLELTKLSAAVLGGSVKGTVSAAPLPGVPRVRVDMDYSDINAAQLARFYPWDPKYIIHSNTQGHIKGWFEERFARYEFEGDTQLTSYSSQPDSGRVALPAQGTVAFAIRPGEIEVRNGDLRIFESKIVTQGKIIGADADLSVDFESPNLTSFNFLHPDLNGKGTFKGTLKGSLQQPVLDGAIDVDGFKYQDWLIRHAEGSASLDTRSQFAELKDIRVELGDSTATIKGTANLTGTSVNLNIQSDHIRAEDFNAITKEKVTGILSGNVTLTSLNPLKVAGPVSAVRLSARGHTLETFSGELTYNDPRIEIRNATASELGTNLRAEILTYDRSNGALNVRADVTSVSFDRLREFGVPETLGGTIQKASIRISGTQDQPRIGGEATIQNLTFRNETFPSARMEFETTWPHLNVTLKELKDLTLSAKVDLSTPGY